MRNEGSGMNSLLTFLVSLTAGAFGIYVGAVLILGTASFSTAIMAALVGAIVWGIASFFLGWIPLLGSIFTLIAWLAAIRWMYTIGWITAAQIAIFAWLTSLLFLSILSILGVTEDTDAVGVPGA